MLFWDSMYKCIPYIEIEEKAEPIRLDPAFDDSIFGSSFHNQHFIFLSLVDHLTARTN